MLDEDRLKWMAERKEREIAAACEKLPLSELRDRCKTAPPPRDFVGALRERIAGDGVAVIAEMKKASPSAGLLRDDYSPGDLALGYEANGAAALSVLTDSEFAAAAECADLVAARAACRLPTLRKDFIIDEYQIYESRERGADCVLLIAAMHGDDPSRMRALAELAVELGMAALPEAHSRAELELCATLPTPLLGVNNRNLFNLRVDLNTTATLAAEAPKDRLLISESGIRGAEDMRKLASVGAQAFLIGASLMSAADPGAELAKWLGAFADSRAQAAG